MLSVDAANALKVYEVYYYFDRPVLYAARDDTRNRLFLVVQVEESADGDRVLMAPIDGGRLESVREGKLTLREAFVNAKGKKVVDVLRAADGTVLKTASRDAQKLPDNLLPAVGARLAIRSPTITSRTDDALESLARINSADVVNIGLNLPGRIPGLAPARYAADLLNGFQGFVEEIALALNRHLDERIRAPVEDIRAGTTLSVFGVTRGSFEVQLMGHQGDLFGFSSLSTSLSAAMYALERGKSQKEFVAAFEGLKGAPGRRLRDLLMLAKRERSGLQLEWHSPSSERGARVSLTAARVTKILGYLESSRVESSTELTVVGPLVAAHSRLLNFEIRDEETGIVYKGKGEDAGASKLGAARINMRYRVKIRFEELSLPLVGERKDRSTLLDLELVRDDE